MATKAELTAELADLRAQMAARDKTGADDTGQPAPGATPDAGPDEAPSTGDWADMLKSQGLDPTDAQALLAQLSDELGELPQNKPLLTAIAAFGLGFALGRMSK